MEEDAPIDAHLRGKALQQAIAAYASIIPYADFDPEESHSDRIMIAAHKFYQFLKGESK